MEALIDAPVSNMASCIEQYGFPSELLLSGDRNAIAGFATCVLTPDGVEGEGRAVAARRQAALRGAQAAACVSESFFTNSDRYVRMLSAVRRGRRATR